MVNNDIFEYKTNKIDINSVKEKDNKDIECLHQNCELCNGTMVRKDGLGICVHMISCPCKKCNPICY